MYPRYGGVDKSVLFLSGTNTEQEPQLSGQGALVSSPASKHYTVNSHDLISATAPCRKSLKVCRRLSKLPSEVKGRRLGAVLPVGILT